MKISPIWLNAFGHFAVCLGPASMILGIATLSLGDQKDPDPVVVLSLFGTLAAALIGIFTRRVLAIVLGASAYFMTAIVIPETLRPRGGNEASAIGSMRSINSAQSTYSSSCGGNGYDQSLEDLMKPAAGSTAGFIAPDLSRNGVSRRSFATDTRGTIYFNNTG
jgi:hypothetical protein